MSKVSENIKRFRMERGLKQSDLAEMLGRSHNVISSWESGVNRPDVDSLEKMLNIFDIDANTLFGWDSLETNAAIEDSFYQIDDGQATKYADLSPENKKIIDAHINFLLSQQNTTK